MSQTIKEVGTKPYAELLDYLDAIFNNPTVNATMLLSNVFYISPEQEMAMNELTNLQLLFTGASESGRTEVSFKMNADGTVGPNKARQSEWRDYITLKSKVERNFLMAMIKNPRTQKLFRDTIAKVEFGKTMTTSQTSRDAKLDELLETMPGRQPPLAEAPEGGERQEEEFTPIYAGPPVITSGEKEE